MKKDKFLDMLSQLVIKEEDSWEDMRGNVEKAIEELKESVDIALLALA